MSLHRKIALVFRFIIGALAAQSLVIDASAQPFSGSYDTEQVAEWRALDNSFRLAWYEKDVDRLEALLAFDKAGEASNGLPLAGLAFRTLEAIVANGDMRHPSQTGMAAFLDTWRKIQPTSTVPDVIEAMHLLHHSASVRRGREGFAPREAGFDPVVSALNQADVLLANLAGRGATSPYAPVVMMKIAIERQLAFEQLLQLAEDAKVTASRYPEPQLVLLSYLVGVRHWDQTHVSAYINTIATAADGKIDPVSYARIHMHLFDRHFHFDLFQQSNVNWEILKAGLQQLARQHSNDWMVNQHAALACIAGDAPEAAQAFAKIGSNVVRKVWRLPAFYEECREWAKQGSAQ